MTTTASKFRTATQVLGAGLIASAVACVDPHDPAKEQTPVDDGPGSAQAAENEARMAEAMKARGPGDPEPEAVAEANVPLPEDFEAEYAQEITEDNYEATLEALEKTIAEE